MSGLTLVSQTPLSSNGSKFKAIAYDGCNFYLPISCMCKIFKYDKNLKYKCTIKTQSCYSALCYDSTENCFWAVNPKYNAKIIKLDRNFMEIDCIILRKCNAIITSISYDCENDALLVSYCDELIRVEKTGDCESVDCNFSMFFQSVLSISPYVISAYLKNCRQMISIYSRKNTSIYNIEIDNLYTVQSMCFVPGDTSSIYVLCMKNGCYPFILKYSLILPNINPCNYNLLTNCKCESQKDKFDKIIAIFSEILEAQSNKLMEILEGDSKLEDILIANSSIESVIDKILKLEEILYYSKSLKK